MKLLKRNKSEYRIATYKEGQLLRVVMGDQYDCNAGEIHQICSTDGTRSVRTICCKKEGSKYVPDFSRGVYYHTIDQFVEFQQSQKKDFEI